MSTTGHQAFQCPQCGKSIIWTSRIAGTRVSCTCGRRFVAPIEPPPVVAAHAQAEDTYDLAGESLLEELPSRGAAVRSRQPVPLKYESKATTSYMTFTDLLRALNNRQVILPAAVVAGGVVLRFCLPLMFSTSGKAQAGAGALVIIAALVVSVVTMLAGVGLVAKFTGADLGSLPVTIARLCMVSVLDSVLFAVVMSIDKGDGMRGMIIAWHAVLLFNWVMFSILFELDTQEALFAVAAVGLLQAVGACALWNR